MNSDGKLYTSANDEELQSRIILAAHCGFVRYHSYKITCAIIRNKVTWEIVDADLNAFIQGFLVFTFSESGIKVLRTLGQKINPEKFRELLHIDYLYIGESYDGK